MREVETPQGDNRLKVVCTWCGDVIRHAASKPTQRMCQPCFAQMMREYTRVRIARTGLHDVSER